MQKSPIFQAPSYKRTFLLMVDPSLLPFTLAKTPMRGYTQHRTKTGYYVSIGTQFGRGKYGKKTPEEIAMIRQAKFDALEVAVATINQHIMKEVFRESERLIQYWFTNVDQYFNRSSHLRYYPSKIIGYKRTKHVTRPKGNEDINRRRPPHKMSTKSYQLRHALHIETMNAFGSRLFVYPCYSRSKGYGTVDYVNILILGAPEKFGNHYVPSINKRIRGGSWGGISARYWTVWWKVFNQEVQRSQDRLNKYVRQYVKQFMRTKDNKVLFDPQLLNANTGKAREFKDYNRVKSSRFNINAKYSDLFKDDSEYAQYFKSDIDVANIKPIDTFHGAFETDMAKKIGRKGY